MQALHSGWSFTDNWWSSGAPPRWRQNGHRKAETIAMRTADLTQFNKEED